MNRALLALNRVVVIPKGLSRPSGPHGCSPGECALRSGHLLAELGIAFSGQGSLIAELEVPDREQRPSGPLAYLLGLLTQEARAGRFGSGRAGDSDFMKGGIQDY